MRGVWEEWRFKMRYLAWSRLAGRIITVSETARQDVMKLCRVSDKQVNVTLLGAGDDTSAPVSLEEEAEILKKYHLDGKNYVVSVMGLDRRHRDPDFIIDAFADCHRRLLKDVYFVFTGNNYRSQGYYERTLRKMEMLGIRDRVIATGFIPDRVFKVILANAAVSVVTPFHSGTSLAVLESFALGVPVIASDCGAVPEMAGEAAVMVDPYDPQAISEALCRLLENTVEHDSYAEKGAARARGFSWDRMAEETLAIYHDVIRK
jgi:glycosyltransferase involved in cell wall biosynthesis